MGVTVPKNQSLVYDLPLGQTLSQVTAAIFVHAPLVTPKASLAPTPPTQNHPADSTHQEFGLGQKSPHTGTVIIGTKIMNHLPGCQCC